MDNKTTIALDCGRRCRRIRMAKNMSQQELADLLNTTPQNISKYEKEGISNIDTIKSISQVLGQDLLKDEIDSEGVVGEVGKEILLILLTEGGYIHFNQLMTKMFGMSEERVSNEIFKLERIGMCVREQYSDWVGQQQDVLFITAKGVITFKNLTSINPPEGVDYSECLTYEHLIGCFTCYQDYVDSRPGEKLIRSFDYGIGLSKEDKEKNACIRIAYRANYIRFLKKHMKRV